MDGVDIRPRHLLHKLPGIGVERIEKTALALGEKYIERQRTFAGTTHPGDHNQFVTGDADGDVAEVVFAGSLDTDPTGIVSRFSPRGHGSHPLGGLEAKRLEAGLEHPARKVAQRQALGAHLALGLQHRAVLVKRSKEPGEFVQVVA